MAGKSDHFHHVTALFACVDSERDSIRVVVTCCCPISYIPKKDPRMPPGIEDPELIYNTT